jgi:hypothetical protein
VLRAVFDAVGGFDEQLRSAQDWDFWVRADLVVGLTPVKLPRPAIRYRYHHAPRLHDESVRNIAQLRTHIRRLTRDRAVLSSRVEAVA